MLSFLLVGVRVKRGVTIVHGKHGIPLCSLLCRLVNEVAFVCLWSAEPMP